MLPYGNRQASPDREVTVHRAQRLPFHVVLKELAMALPKLLQAKHGGKFRMKIVCGHCEEAEPSQ
ncbi:Protein of unknown function [Gryllus bimaculatus]|nr:Protein of unknown function [Gryllus bimaculatus]